MASVDMKLLRNQLNSVCVRAMENGTGVCLTRTHYEITVEHMVSQLLDVGNCDLLCICDHFKLDVSSIRAALNRCLDELKVGNSGRPQFSPFLAEWLSEGWQIASLELGQRSIRSGALVLALLRNPNRAYFTDYTDQIGKISEAELKSKFLDITGQSIENDAAGGEGAATPAQAAGTAATGEALTQFTYDLTERARDGRVDPVIGREREIRQCIDILMRRFQNNPLIIGEPGTGKTAIVEGLALRIAAGDVPPFLAGITLLSLDIGLLSAGASVKGEFERRLKAVIKEVDASNAAGKPIVLFIDEAHQLIGGGGGGTDAAQLLKPALARGELRTIAATTFAEYKKYIEKDAPFAQRFGIIRLDEPSVDVCTDMLRGTKDKFEQHHHVLVLDEAVRAAVSMANQYLAEQQLPRKAVSLLDTACARVAVAMTAPPGPLEDIRRRLIQLDVAIKAITRDAEAGHGTDPEELAALQREREQKQTAFEELEKTWNEEKELAGQIIKLRGELEAATTPAEAPEGSRPPEAVPPAEGTAESETPPAEAEEPREPEAIRAELDELNTKLSAFLDQREPLVPLQVDSEIVAQVLSDWTGIPAGNMVKDTAQAMLTFEDRIGQRIIGQDHAIGEIGKRLRIAAGKLQDPEFAVGGVPAGRPVGHRQDRDRPFRRRPDLRRHAFHDHDQHDRVLLVDERQPI